MVGRYCEAHETHQCDEASEYFSGRLSITRRSIEVLLIPGLWVFIGNYNSRSSRSPFHEVSSRRFNFDAAAAKRSLSIVLYCTETS